MEYSDLLKELVWIQAPPFPGLEHLADLIRMDEDENPILRFAYGNYRSVLGWEVDHRWPKDLGGPDELWNLRALQCSANRSKQDSFSFPYRSKSGESGYGQGSYDIWSDGLTREHTEYGRGSYAIWSDESALEPFPCDLADIWPR